MIVIPIDNNITNCFIPLCIENVLSVYLNFKGYEYQYAFAHALDFKFDANKCCGGRVADGLDIKYNFIEWLNKLYNIDIHKIEFTSVEKLIQYINKNIKKNNPVIIHLDSYYLPWSTLYNKEHTGHMVIAIDVDIKNNIIKILDTIETKYNYDIEKETLSKACTFVWDISLPQKPKVINPQQYNMKISKGEKVLVPKNRIKMLKLFADVFKENFEPSIEFRNQYDLDLMRTEKLVDDIRKIILQINLFCNWMIWLDKNMAEKNFESVTEIYLQVMSKWNVFVNLLYKNCIKGWQKSFRVRGYTILTEIIHLEECANVEFMERIDNRRCVKKSIELLGNIKKYYPVLLEDKYNNKGFCYDEKLRNYEDLTGVGEYFVIKEKVMHDLDVFSYNIQNNYDNIACEGQIILINNENETSEMYFLACAEWGAVDERLFIVGDKESQQIILHIEDLSQVNEGTPFFLGKTYDIRGNIVQENAAVFLYKLSYSKTRVRKIILPNCPNLHILDLVLAGKD